MASLTADASKTRRVDRHAHRPAAAGSPDGTDLAKSPEPTFGRTAATFVDVPGRRRRSTVKSCPWVALVVGRAGTAGDGVRRPAPARPDGQPRRTRVGRRHARVPTRRRPGRAVPQPGAARQPRPALGRADRRRRQRRRCWPASSLWWRRRWPVGVAIACLLLGTISTSATPAGSARAVLPGRASPGPGHRAGHRCLWVPSVLVFAVYSPTTDPVSVVLLVMPLALAASGWGMFIRARRQLLLSLRERALRAEADQRAARGAGAGGRTHPDRPRDARRPRPPDLADGAARRRARGPTGPAAGRRSGRPPPCCAPRPARHSRSCAA